MSLQKRWCVLAVLGVGLAGNAQAGTDTWQGGTNTWGAGFSPTWTSGDTAQFNGTGSQTVVANLNAAQTAAGISVTGAQTGSVLLEGGGTASQTLTLGSGGLAIASGAGAVTVGSSSSNQGVTVNLSASQAWQNNSSSLLTVVNNISNVPLSSTPVTLTINGSGSGGTTLSGVVSDSGTAGGTTALAINTTGGTTTISNANTYSGGTTLTAGNVLISNSAAFGTGTLTLAGGHLENVNGNGPTLTNTVNVTGSTVLVANGGANFTLNGPIIGGGTISNDGSGGLSSLFIGNNLSGFTGTFSYVDNGTNNVFFSSPLNTTAAFTLSGASGQTLRINGASTIGSLSGTGGIITGYSGGAILNVNQSTTTTFAGALTNASASIGLTKSGTGTLTLSGTSNSYSLATTANGGVLNLSGSLTGGGAVSANAGGTFTESGTGLISGASSVTAGGGNVNLSGTNTYSGATTVTGGGTLTLDFTQTGAPATNIVASTATLTLSGGSLVLNGKASTTNSQTFGGGTTVTNGTSITLNPNVTANPLLLSLGTISRTAGVGGIINFNLAGSGTPSATNGVTTTNTNNANGTLLDFTYGGTDWAAVSGGNVVSYTSNGGTYVTAGNTASAYNNANVNIVQSVNPNGAITPNTLRFNTATRAILALQSGSTNVISSGGVLITSNVGANNTAIVGGTLEGSSGVSLDVMQNDASATLTIGSVIANNGSATGLNVSGVGTVLLTGANTYSGVTTVGGGSTLVLGNGVTNGTLGSGGTVLDGGTLISNSSSGTNLGAITANGASTIGYVNGNTFLNQQGAINAAGYVLNYAGSLSSTYGLASTAGYTSTLGGELYLNGITLTASQFNIVSGAVVINNNNTINAPINVANGATLGAYSGAGISANITFNGGGGTNGLGAFAQQNGSSTLSGTITLASGVSSFDTAAGNTTISGVITGSGGLAKSYYGNTLTLTNAANNYTGTTGVDGGTLQLTFSGAGSNMLYNGVTAGTLSLGGAPSTTSYQYYNQTNSTLSITGASSQNNSQTFGNTVAAYGLDTITAANGSSGGLILNLGALTNSGGGILNFTNNSPISAPSSTNAITATGTSNGIFGAWATVGNSDFATLNSSGQVVGLSTISGGYTAATTSIANGASTNVSASSTSVTTGSGTTTINAARFTGGSTTLTLGGVLDVGASGGFLNDTGNLTINSGTLTTVSGGGNITINNPGSTISIGSVITDNGGAVSLTLYESSGATGNLSGNNTYSGGTYIEGGRWNFSSNNIGSGLVTVLDGSEAFLNGGTYANNFAVEGTGWSNETNPPHGSIRSAGSVILNGTITVLGDTEFTDQNGSLTFNGQITGNGNIDFNDVNGYSNINLGNTGTGTLANNWTGNTIIDNPVVQNAANQLPSGVGKGNVTVDSTGASGGTNASYLNLNGFNLAINGLSGSGMVENTTGSAQFSIGNNNQSFSSGNLLTDSSGSLTLVKSGSGFVTLTNNSNSYHGGTIVNGGTLQMGAANALGATTGALTVNTGGTLDLNNNSLTVGVLSGTGGVISSYNSTASALTLTGSNTTTSTFTGSIQNGTATSISLVKNGTGTLDLNGVNTYTGTTTINAGTLDLGNGGSLANLSSLSFGSSTASLQVGDSNGSNNITLTAPISGAVSTNTVVGGASSTSTVTLNGVGTQTYANAFGGAGTNNNNLALVISGTGTTPTSVLSGTSTYIGTTTVNSGANLNLTGALGATAVTINSGATLSGGGSSSTTGVMGGTLTAVGGSTIILANGAGHLNATGNITLGTTGAYNSSDYTTLLYNLSAGNAVESLNTAGTLTLNTGGAYVDISNPTQLGTFTLATYTDGTAPTGFSLSSTMANVTSELIGSDTVNLTVSSGSLVLSIVGTATPGLAYFDGAHSTVWSSNTSGATNFSSNLAGTTDTGNTPGSNSDVILNATNATTNQGNPLTETLGGSTAINSLRVNSNGTTTIAADASTLTIVGNADSNIVTDGTFTAGSQTAGVGIVIASGASSFTINAPIVVGSAASTSATQTWTNNSANLFTVGGNVTGSSSAPTTLALSNTGVGGTTLSGVIADGAGQTLAVAVNNTGAGVTTFSNSGNSYSGGTTLNDGTLTSTVSGGFGAGSVTVNPTMATSSAADNATLNSNTSIASTAVVTVNSEASDGGFGIGTINFNSATPTIGSLAGNGNVVLNNVGGTTLTVGSTNSLSSTFSGVISNGAGTGGLTKAGTGTLVLAGANTYSGATAVTAGTLAIGPGGSFANTPSITLGNGGSSGGTLQLGSSAGIGNLTLTQATSITGSGSGANSIVGGYTSTSTLTINSTTAYALGTSAQPIVLGGAGTNQNNLALNDIGSGTVTISNANLYTGGTSIGAGASLVDNSNSNGFGGNVSTNTVTIAGAGLAQINIGGNNNYNYTYAGNGTIRFNFTGGGSDTTAASTSFNGFTGTLELANPNGGSNKLQINGDAGVSGATLLIDSGATAYVNGGTTNFGSIIMSGTGNSEGLGAIRIQSNAILGGNVTVLSSTTIGDGGGTFTGNVASGASTGTQTITIVSGAGNNTVGFSGNISNGSTGGAIALTLNHGGDTTTLSGTNSYSGATLINSSNTLVAGSTGAFSSASAVTDNGVLNTTGYNTSIGSLAGTGSVTLGTATLTMGGDNTSPAAFSGIVGGSGGGITKTGTGTETLTGANIYTGSTSVTGGTLQIGNGLTGSINSSSSVSVGASGTLAVDQATGTSFSPAITDNGLVLGAEGSGITNTFASAISGTGGAFTQSGAGTSIFAAANSYTGATTINAGGTLQLGINAAIGSSSSVTDNGTLALGTYNDTVAGLTLGSGGTGTVTGSTGVLTSTTTYNLQNGTVSGILGGSVGASVNSLGTVYLTGANTFTGQTTVSGNSVVVYENGTAFGGNSAIVVQGGSAAQVEGNISGGSQSLTISGAGTSGSGSDGALENVSGSNSYAGQVISSGNSTITSDSGSLTLTGGVSIGASTLTVNGPGNTTIGAITGTTGKVTANSNAYVTLTGANTYTGNTTISSGATVQLGNGGTTGSLSTSSSIVGSGGTFAVDRSNAVTQGTDFKSTISGLDAFSQIGTGTTTLTGNNNYSGGTTVSSGGLVLTSAGTTGSGSLSVTGGTFGGTGVSNGTGFSISGSGTTTSTRANVLVGMTSASDTNTTSMLALVGSSASTIQNANLTFNLSTSTPGALGSDPSGSGTELSVGNTAIGFGTNQSSVNFALNLQNEPGIVGAFTPYVLIAGTDPTGGIGANGSQYSGLTLGNTIVNSNGVTETIITGNNLQLAFGSAIDTTYYGANSYLVLYQNTNTGADDIDVVVVPEPSTWALMLGGVACLLFWQRRRKNS